METKVFAYRLKPSTLLLGTLLVAICTQVLAYDDSPDTIRWVLARLAGLLTICGLLSLGAILRVGTRRVVLAGDRLIAPRHLLTRAAIEVPYTSIQGTRTASVFTQAVLEIRHAGGTLTIFRSAMPSQAAFDELTRLLAVRLRT